MTIALHILRLLGAAGDKMTPEDTLRLDLRQMLEPQPPLSEINAAFRKLEERNLAVQIRDDLGLRVRWRITDEGRAELASRNLL